VNVHDDSQGEESERKIRSAWSGRLLRPIFCTRDTVTANGAKSGSAAHGAAANPGALPFSPPFVV
jgi:hypothetical protein